MKKRLVMLVALVAVVAIALPAFALEFKYGGLYQLRWQSNNNVTDGRAQQDEDLPGQFDDNQNYMDQRLRMYFSFIASENLQVVTKWEVDTLWGQGVDKFTSGGGVGADSINLEMKNVYVEFNVPYTPVRSTLGVQGIELMPGGWIISDDFSAAKFSAKFDPIKVTLGYIAGQNNDVTDERENIDDIFLGVEYAQGPFKASLYGLFQDGHNTDVSTFFNPRTSSATRAAGANFNFLPGLQANTGKIQLVANDGVTRLAEDNMLFDLGIDLGYKLDWVSAYLKFVKNFGSFDALPDVFDQSVDYTGYMVEGGANFYYGPFTFSLGGFLASGDNFDDSNELDSDGNFRYPRGASHYWSEILGLGTLDATTGASPIGTAPSPKTGDSLKQAFHNPPGFNGYQASDEPSNLWMVNAGVAYQALEKTKLTFNYYYIGTQVKVLSGFDDRTAEDEFSHSIGHELDFYIDQGIVDGLNLRIVGAYLFSNAGYTIANEDNDTWEAGFKLSWAF
jgi:hypothetical protein